MSTCTPSLLLLVALAACSSASTDGTNQPAAVAEPTTTTTTPEMSDIYGLSATTIDGKPFTFDQLKGRKVLVVNTASECGYTPQYAQLQELHVRHKAYGDKGLVIIGFPCNDFGAQEPGSEQDIAAFCSKNYGVSFAMMAKVHTTGIDQHPVYRWLTSKSENGVLDTEVKWNFHKFLIDEQGHLVKDLPSRVGPMDAEVVDWVKG